MPMMVRENEVRFFAVRASGAGGQNIQKVSSAVQLRFDIAASSLPEGVKARLLALRDQRITDEGVVVIKAQQHRTQQRNREAALERLEQLVRSVATPPKPRRATKPTRAAKRKRLEGKLHRGRIKALRGRVAED